MRPKHERLNAPPLREAVFEIRGEIGRPFSLVPGSMAAALRAEYPDAGETDLAPMAGMLSLAPLAGLPITHFFRNSSGRRRFQLGPNGLSVNVLDYVDSFDFESDIRKVLSCYFEIGQLSKVVRLGLRYVNLFGRTDGMAPLTVDFQWPALAGASQTTTINRSEFRFENPTGTLGVVIASPDLEGLTRLDMDFFSEPGLSMTVDSILDWFDGAHERIYDAFRLLATPAQYSAWRNNERDMR
jgi:uncharacterized protein (TIGR04255 family)